MKVLDVAALIVDLSLKSTLILTLAWLACLALRRSSAALRHLIWTLALLGLLLSPALSLLTPWKVPVLPTAPALLAGVLQKASLPQLAPALEHGGWTAAPADPPRASSTSQAPARRAPDQPISTSGHRLSPDTRLLLLWLAGALAVLAVSLSGLGRIWYLSHSAESLTDDSWRALAAELSRKLGIRALVRLKMSLQSSVPMVWGLWRPVLLLPAEAEDWSPERRRVVLLHELAHIQRADCLIQWLSQFVSAAFWFQPLVWMALRHHRLEREKACDDQVLLAGTRASDYAGHLLDLAAASRTSYAPPMAALTMARRSELEGRLLSILDGRCLERGLSRRIAVVTGLGALALILPLGMLQPRMGSASVAEAAPRKASPSSPSRASLAEALKAASTLRVSDTSEALAKRWSWGVQAAADRSADVWIGYSFERPMAANEWIGNLNALNGEIVDLADHRVDRTGEVRKEIAVLLAVPARGVAIEAIRVSNIEFPMSLGDRRLVWLGKAGDTESLDLLERLFREASDASVRADLVEAIGVHTVSSRVVPFLFGVLRGQDAEEVRAEAASGLGRHESEASRAALAEAVRSDRSSRVRQEATQGLARHRSPAALTDLIRAAREGSPVEVRRVATEELGRWPADSSLPVLVEIAYQDLDTEIQRTATEALGNLPNGAGVAALQKIARDHPAPDVRRQAMESLGATSSHTNGSR